MSDDITPAQKRWYSDRMTVRKIATKLSQAGSLSQDADPATAAREAIAALLPIAEAKQEVA